MKIALVCTHGGHLTELLRLLKAFDGHEIFFATHYSARDEEIKAIAPVYFCKNIGARIHRFGWAVIWALWILLKEKPDVIVSTGSEIALPFFFWGKLLGIRSIFIESWCRVEKLSRTGKLAYPLVDEFWVQWPQLLCVCGKKARYHGSVI